VSLNYYYSKVKNADTVMFDEDDMMYADTQSIIFTTMALGMGSITKENWLEFYARMNILERIHGFNPIPPQRLKEHIGLTTNVNYEPRGEWLRRYFDYEIDDIMRKVKRECEVSQRQS